MTDIDMSTGTTSEYLVAIIVFWIVLVVGVLFVYRYVWPVVVHLYVRVASWLYWTLVDFCHDVRGHTHSYYTGYPGGRRHHKKGRKS